MEKSPVDTLLVKGANGRWEEVKMGTIIVTCHSGAMEFLRQHGIEGDVVAHATEHDVRDKHVIGAVPFHLAALAAKVTVIDLPALPEEWRGRDLSYDEMVAAGAALRTYVVRQEEDFFAAVDSAAMTGMDNAMPSYSLCLATRKGQ